MRFEPPSIVLYSWCRCLEARKRTTTASAPPLNSKKNRPQPENVPLSHEMIAFALVLCMGDKSVFLGASGEDIAGAQPWMRRHSCMSCAEGPFSKHCNGKVR
jgi:hypothetical protein